MKSSLENLDAPAVSRRKFLQRGALTVAGAAGLAAFQAQEAHACMECLSEKLGDRYPIGKTAVVGNKVIPVGSTGKAASSPSGGSAPDELMDPRKYLTAFDYGQMTQLADATSQREYRVVAEDKEIEIAEGIKVPAWVYNGFMPGPTLRATVGDRIIIHFENRGSKPHTMHFHGIHPANMDGVFEVPRQGYARRSRRRSCKPRSLR